MTVREKTTSSALNCCMLFRNVSVSYNKALTSDSSSLPDIYFITTVSFLWKVTVITLVSCLPLYILKYLRRRFSPPSYSKLTS